MAFVLYNDRCTCAHRRAGRVLSRLAGLGAIRMSRLFDLMDVAHRFGGDLWP